MKCASFSALLMLLFAPAIVAAEEPFNGASIGTPVSMLALTLGSPADVTSADSGNRFVFAGGMTAYTDDDGIVLAVDTETGNPRIDIDGTLHAFEIGAYSTARADAELGDVAEFATPTLRSYRLAPRRDLVFAFAAASQRLERVTYGEPGQLARLGLLPGDAATKAVAYRAPQLGHTTVDAPATGPYTTVYRITIDRAGTVTAVDVAIASALPASDAEIAHRLQSNHYRPATLDGRPIGASVFVELHH